MSLNKILLLDSSLYKKYGNETEKFTILADYLLNKTCVFVNNKRVRICEIEIYLKSDKHNDPFVHCSDDQQTPLNWYFHKQNGTYKSGTYKGLDITFGYKDESYGGILIRSIKPDNEDLIEGPCKCVDWILKECNCETISDLTNNNVLSCLNTDSLYLKKHNYESESIFTGPRVGLTLKKKSGARTKYLMKDYRFLIYPKNIKKYKNTLIASLIENYTEDEIVTKLSCSKNSVSKVSKLYIDSNKNANDYFGKSLKADDLVHLYKACKKVE